MMRQIEAALLSNNTIEVQQLPVSFLFAMGEFLLISLVKIKFVYNLSSWSIIHHSVHFITHQSFAFY